MLLICIQTRAFFYHYQPSQSVKISGLVNYIFIIKYSALLLLRAVISLYTILYSLLFTINYSPAFGQEVKKLFQIMLMIYRIFWHLSIAIFVANEIDWEW